MARAFILVMDSFGVGAAPDAARFGDQGSDTLGHIVDAYEGELVLPNLARRGLAALHGRAGLTLGYDGPLEAAYGRAKEHSMGKDTPSGHWEIAGVPVPFDWGYFPETVPAFPADFTQAFIERCGLSGILGNCHASGTEIIARLGDEHRKTGQPICYTSADSVFQIAAHEEDFGLERLYEICAIAKEMLEPLNIARVIARPFVGVGPDTYKRTANRKDLTTPPPAETLLDKLVAAGREVISVGKIADIFAHRGITRKAKGDNNMALFDRVLEESQTAPEGSLIFANFVDFDSQFGHRRDVAGYAQALMDFDARLPELDKVLQDDDLVLITADHGCDPTWQGTDHTREWVPVIFYGPKIKEQALGDLDGFSTMGHRIAEHLGVSL